MKAVYYDGKDAFYREDYPVPKAGEQESLVQILLSAVNNDEQTAQISVPVPFAAEQARLLLTNDKQAEETVFPVENGRLTLTLPPCGGMILRL